MKKEDCRMKIKLMMIGEQAVGKTSLTKRYTEKVFSTNIMGTAGLDMHKKIVKINDENLNVTIYDSAGHERFRKITEVQYKGSDGLVLVYDITDSKSFDWIIEWIDKLKSENIPNMEIILIGNKIDLEGRKITRQETNELANKYNIPFMETSALTGENVDEAFTKIIQNIYHSKTLNIIKKQDENDPKFETILQNNMNNHHSTNKIISSLDNQVAKKKKSCCCFK